MEYKIVIVKVDKRVESSVDVQGILTEYGCSIKIRLGLHDVPFDQCSPGGLIFLQVYGDDKPVKEMIDKLNRLESVTAKYLTI